MSSLRSVGHSFSFDYLDVLRLAKLALARDMINQTLTISLILINWIAYGSIQKADCMNKIKTQDRNAPGTRLIATQSTAGFKNATRKSGPYLQRPIFAEHDSRTAKELKTAIQFFTNGKQQKQASKSLKHSHTKLSLEKRQCERC